MTSENGHRLNPHRKLRKQKGIKGIRRTLFNTHVPSTVDQTGILTVRFPDLGKEDVIVPGTSKLSFKLQLNSDDDANRTIFNNLGRAIVRHRSQIRPQLSAAGPTNSPQPKVIKIIIIQKLKLWPAASCEAKAAAEFGSGP